MDAKNKKYKLNYCEYADTHKSAQPIINNKPPSGVIGPKNFNFLLKAEEIIKP